MTTEKEERSEYVGLYVTPTFAKELKLAGDNEKLKQEVLSITLQAKRTNEEISKIDRAIGYIDYSKLEKLLLLVEKYNTMSETEKELIKMLLKNE